MGDDFVTLALKPQYGSASVTIGRYTYQAEAGKPVVVLSEGKPVRADGRILKQDWELAPELHDVFEIINPSARPPRGGLAQGHPAARDEEN